MKLSLLPLVFILAACGAPDPSPEESAAVELPDAGLDAAPPRPLPEAGPPPTMVELCSAGRSPDDPCELLDGTVLRGVCCVLDGAVGTCGGFTVDTGPLLDPLCVTP